MSETARPFIVEFCGPPGSGKSTLIRQVHQRLVEQGIPSKAVNLNKEPALGRPETPGRLRAQLLFAVLRRPVLAARLSLQAARTSPRAAITGVGGVCHSLLLLQRLRTQTSGVVLVDEGPIHKLLLWWWDRKFDAPIPKGVPSVDVVVCVSADATLAVRRAHERYSDAPLSESELHRGIQRTNNYLHHAGQLTDAKVCAVDTWNSVEDESRKLAAILAETLTLKSLRRRGRE